MLLQFTTLSRLPTSSSGPTQLLVYWCAFWVLFLLRPAPAFAPPSVHPMPGYAQRHPLSLRLVHTQYGSLRGILVALEGRGLHPVEAFLGVPYATPPTGGLRFMPPITPSSWEGVRTADRMGPPCPQTLPPSLRERPRSWTRFLTNYSEDCLYLNIYYPTIDGHASPGERPPVLLLVHGESLSWGSGNLYDASVLASRGRLLVATVSFRLGILGFLKTSPRDSPQGNYGLLDVVAALHWLHHNAAAFGGDASRLTVLGLGSGAALVNLLMLSPVAKGLFQGAVLLGGSAMNPGAVSREPEEIRQEVALKLGCWTSDDPINNRYDLAPCLRRLSLESLLNVNVTSPRFLPPLAPFVDGSSVRAFPRELMQERAEAEDDCDLLVGLTPTEFVDGLELRELTRSVNEERRDRLLRTLVRNLFDFHTNEILAVLRNEYTDWDRPGQGKEPWALRASTLLALQHALVVAPAMEILHLRSSARRKNGKTFMFTLDNEREEGEEGIERGTTDPHSIDVVALLLGYPLVGKADFSGRLPNPEYVDLSEQLIAYVAGFCYAGDPNEHGENKVGERSLNWEPFTEMGQKYLQLGLPSRIRSHYQSHRMSVWLRLVPQLHHPGDEDIGMAHHQFREQELTFYEGPVRPLLVTRPPTFTTTPFTTALATVSPPQVPPDMTDCPTPSLPLVVNVPSTPVPVTPSTQTTTTLWPLSYGTMLGLTVAIGATLLILNLVAVTCFCYHRQNRRRTNKTKSEEEKLHSKLSGHYGLSSPDLAVQKMKQILELQQSVTMEGGSKSSMPDLHMPHLHSESCELSSGKNSVTDLRKACCRQDSVQEITV